MPWSYLVITATVLSGCWSFCILFSERLVSFRSWRLRTTFRVGKPRELDCCVPTLHDMVCDFPVPISEFRDVVFREGEIGHQDRMLPQCSGAVLWISPEGNLHCDDQTHLHLFPEWSKSTQIDWNSRSVCLHAQSGALIWSSYCFVNACCPRPSKGSICHKKQKRFWTLLQLLCRAESQIRLQ